MNAPDRNKVRDVFLTTLREFLGENAPAEITETTDPFKDLGLDSEDGVEFACVLSEKFGCKVPDEVNPLVDDAGQCSRLVGGAIDLMCALIPKGGS
ncbi:MAG: phosphopantetheine-binding protein [Opitutaceae bacterium]|nr:phosphopantetheine-binding protein [Opitutaceae bacterium]